MCVDISARERADHDEQGGNPQDGRRRDPLRQDGRKDVGQRRMHRSEKVQKDGESEGIKRKKSSAKAKQALTKAEEPLTKAEEVLTKAK